MWTAHHWQHWLDRGNFPDHPWREYLQRSALTLKGLTYTPTGALIAAATTSLPETPHGERNWDYRYSWIRDSTFMLWALYTLGFDWEANDFFYFIADVADRKEDLQVMYGVGGERELDEHVPQPPDRIRGRPPRPDRQRRLQAGAARRLGRAARLGLPAHALARLARRARLADPRPRRSRRRSRTGASQTAGSGRSAASPSTSPSRRCPAGSRATAARGSRRSARSTSTPSAGGAVADEIHADVLRARGRLARRVRPALRHRRARRLAAARAADPLPAARGPTDPQHGAGDRRRADRGRARPALPHRGDRRRPLGRRGQLHDLLVPAGLGAL